MSRAPRPYAPKDWAPGYQNEYGTVWADAPAAGERWVLGEGGALRLVKVTNHRKGWDYTRAMERDAWRETLVIRECRPGWQRDIVRTLDYLAGVRLWRSDSERGHLEHADLDCVRQATAVHPGSGYSGYTLIRKAMRAERPTEALEALAATLCPDCTLPQLTSAAA